MSQPQSQTLIDLSNQLAGAVERGAESILAVHARPQLASTGVHWQYGLVVTTNGTVQSTLPVRGSRPRTLVGVQPTSCRRPGPVVRMGVA